MVRYASKFDTEVPYSLPNKCYFPKIDLEEGLPPGGLDVTRIDQYRRDQYHWHEGLKWYDRLHAHATMNSARKHVRCKRPFAPKDDLDFVLEAIYDPVANTFAEKMDPYLHMETAYGEDMNIIIKERILAKIIEYHPSNLAKRLKINLTHPMWQAPTLPEKETWRLFRNRFVVTPDKSIPRSHPIKYADPGNQRRENIYNVKLGIAADHSPQTNPGYSRTPSGAFYSI